MRNSNRPQVDYGQSTVILTQTGIENCLPKIARGESRASFGLNKNHGNHMHVAKNPTNVGDPNKDRK